jgi:hypothetical protein
MADIEMTDNSISMGRSPESEVQQGGGGSIEMLGESMRMGHSPVSSVPPGKGTGGMEWLGDASLLSSRTPHPPYGATYPSDKGK